MKRSTILGLALGLAVTASGLAQSCLSQSQMPAADREALAAAARAFAAKVQAGDQAGVRGATIAEYAKDFGGIGETITGAAAKLKGETDVVDQVYVLDASTLKKNADGSAGDAQFYCTLNRSTMETDFSIPGLPPGRYGFAMVRFSGATPYLLSLLLRQDGGQWLLAGLSAKATTAAGHDGVWYWTQARAMAARKEVWNAYLYYEEARTLLQPAVFVSSTHLEALRTESVAAAPPALSNGIGPDAPLVVKAADGTEYRFTGLTIENALGSGALEAAAHLKVDQMGDADAARKRNLAAMAALVKAYPELRKTFHGVWIFAEVPGQSAVPTEASMEEIH